MTLSGLEVVDEVRKFLGARYVYGGAGPDVFDCSGLAQYVYKQLGRTIPRTSSEQFASGTPVTAAEALPGDLVFFGGGLYDGTPSSPGHVGIYIGNNQMINAPHPGTVVQVSPIDGNVGFRRYDDQTGAGLTGAGAGGLGGVGSNIVGDVGGAANSLLSWPVEIVQAFADFDHVVAAAYDALKLFFQPSTYVRLGAGIAGTAFVLTGLVFLMREARDG